MRQAAQVAASIAEFGFTSPVLVDSRDCVVAGHGRLSALRKPGLAGAPPTVLDHLSETQQPACVLAGNRLALNARWDGELLAEELAAPDNDDFDLRLIAFSQRELAELMADPGEAPAPAAEEEFSLPSGEGQKFPIGAQQQGTTAADPLQAIVRRDTFNLGRKRPEIEGMADEPQYTHLQFSPTYAGRIERLLQPAIGR